MLFFNYHLNIRKYYFSPSRSTNTFSGCFEAAYKAVVGCCLCEIQGIETYLSLTNVINETFY